jgi:hypothetical protein
VAARFWVGGTGTWNSTNTANWSATSGGAGGASVPGAADDVTINTASITVTTDYNVSVISVTINASAATLSLGGTLTCTGTITITQGTFTTNNFNVTATALSSSNSNTRTINLGSSTVTIGFTGINFSSSTGLTFNAGTSTVVMNSSGSVFHGGSRTFNNVNFTGTGSAAQTIQGANVFNNLSFVAQATASVNVVNFSASQTINGTLSTTGTAGNRRVWFRSETYGIAQTLTINSAPSLTDADFRDIYVIGTAAPISGTRIGDLRGCRGITFDTPKTVYWSQATGGNWSGTNWSDSAGGTPNNIYFPLAQDTATVVNTGLNSGATITWDSAILYTGTLDLSGRSITMGTISTGASGPTFYGDLLFGTATGTNIGMNSAAVFSGRNTQRITSNGRSPAGSGGFNIDSYGGTVELVDALNIGGTTLTVTNGTFDTKNYNVTAGNFTSNNSNVRTINLGSSTVTLSGEVTFTASTNLTFNSGTSSITFSSSATTVNGGAQTFYNVSFSSTSSSTHTINQSNTFNSLSITAPASAGLRQVSFAANQTITGTLTVAGATAVRRIFVRSDTIGTTRTLTVNSLSATDCDFRDITIAGTAAGSSPTRAGDCGGNTGITFPAAKTVYWNLAGTNSWTATAWAPGSGGTPDINNFPLPQDTAVINDAGAVTRINASTINVGTIDFSARTTAVAFALDSTFTIYGNITLSSAVTLSGGNGQIFAGRGTTTITSAGKAFLGSITVECVTGTVQLADAFTSFSLNLNSGTFDAITYNVTLTSNFSAASAVAPVALKMGSGTWTLSGTATVWNLASSVPVFYKGTANIVLSDTSTTARTFDGGGRSYNKLTIGGATGTSTLTISGNNQFTELASTKTVAHTIALGTTAQTFGAWTVSGTAGNVVTLTGTGTGHILAGACTSGIDYLAMGSIGFAATSPGEFYAGANSTGTAAAPVYRTAKPADSTRYWVGGTGNWSDTARWSTGSGGGSGASVPRSHDDVVFDALSNATAYTATVNAVTGGIRTKALTIAGPLLGNLTLAGSTAIDGIHGDVTLPATGLTRTYTGGITLSGSSTGRTLTTNGVVLASAITVNGVGCEWALGSAFSTTSTLPITLANGVFGTGSYAVTAGGFVSSLSNGVSLSLGSSAISLGDTTPINFGATETVRAALSLNSGTSQINLSGTNPTFSGNGKTFYNVAFTSTSAGTVTLNGTNTFNDLSVTGITSAGLKNVSVTANQTVNGTLTLSAGTNATMRTFLQSNTIGTTRTLTCAAVASLTDIDFRDITIAGAAAPVSGTRLGDCKGNSGITFDAAKTVYWRGGTGTFGAANWSDISGGSTNTIYFPLAQDTAIFNDANVTTGATATVNAGFNLGTINMSGLVSNTMTLATGTTTPAIYGNWINGTGTTLTGTGTLTFAGRGSQTITSAGVTFTQRVTVDSPGGSVALQDAFTSSNANPLTVTSGTLNANSYNITLSGSGGGVVSSNTNVRTIAIGSGTWTLAGNSTNAWNVGTSTNLTVTGTGVISLTNASAKNFVGGGISYSGITLNQGGAGTLTITGNNTFANITNSYSATGATTIAMGTTTQTVGSFTASGEAGRVLTVQGTSASSPATLVFTGSGQATAPTTDYLTITGVRAYSLDTTWYAGANSTNNGSLGWYFEAGGGGPIAVFIIESATSADAQSSLATLNIGVSESITAADAQAAGFICLGTLSESATVADAVEAFRASLALVVESATSSELVNAALTLSATISEITTGADQLAARTVLNSSLSELAAIADSAAGGLLFLSNISEATTAQELATALGAFNRAILEAAAVQDSSAVAASTFSAASAETAQAVESFSPAGSVYNSSFAGSSSMSDTSQAARILTLSVSESAGVTDVYSCKFTAASYIIERSVMTFGPISVTTIRFDYEAVKDLYNRKRTVYVPRSSIFSERVLVVPAMNRTVYVPRESVSAERTGMVSVVDRAVYVSGRSTSDDRTTSVDE